MFSKDTYMQRRAELKAKVGSGVLLFIGNDEQGLSQHFMAYFNESNLYVVSENVAERYVEHALTVGHGVVVPRHCRLQSGSKRQCEHQYQRRYVF